MRYSQHSWLTKRTWIPYKDFSTGHHITPTHNPMSIQKMALLSIILTVAHMKLETRTAAVTVKGSAFLHS